MTVLRVLIVIYCVFGSYFVLAGGNLKNLWQFKNMIEIVTKKSAFEFNGYGCFCGINGKGTPLDVIDACCQLHDRCYSVVSNEFHCEPKVFNIYDYDAGPGFVECFNKEDTCEYRVCKCDKDAVDCFYKNLATYDPNMKLPLAEKLKKCVAKNDEF